MINLSPAIPGIELKKLHQTHIPEILGLMNKEGWYYYDARELERYLSLNQPCFTLTENGRVIGSIFTTDFGDQAWIGNIIVAEHARGKGLASAMLQKAIQYLTDTRQIPRFRLGSVPLAIGLYKKAGFRPEGFTTAQAANLPIFVEPEIPDLDAAIHIEKIQPGDLGAIAELDARFFNSHRLTLLTALFEDSIKESSLCLKKHNKIFGFIMMRRRKASKAQCGLALGPDHVYRLGPASVLPEYGINGFKALFRQAIRAVNREAGEMEGSARIYVVFPRNGRREDIYTETLALAKAMDMDAAPCLDRIFDQHNLIFNTGHSAKNDAQWRYMKGLGFQQEYFEQVMCFSPQKTGANPADTEGLFASATPGDKS